MLIVNKVATFEAIATQVLIIIAGYHCSAGFKAELEAIKEDKSVMIDKEAFIEKVLEVIPEEGTDAFYSLRLFESLVT